MELTRRHQQRLRQMFRSAGWPCQDLIEADLLAAGLLERVLGVQGHERVRVTDHGVAAISAGAALNRQALSAHEALVRQAAQALQRAGRLVWRGLRLRVPLAPDSEQGTPSAGAESSQLAIEQIAYRHPDEAPGRRWALCCPDLFSVRHTSVEAYLWPEVHEIKVSRADLLGDLRRPGKRAAYLALGGACWYVLGCDAAGRPIAQPHEVPPDCGVLQCRAEGLVLLRPAPRRALQRLPFATWMALARAAPQTPTLDEDAAQAPLRDLSG